MICTAFCDLMFCPVSFDFVTWLVRAAYEKEQRKCEQLHVVIVPYEEGLGGFSRHWGKHDEAATRWRLWHIVLPACQLAGATVTLSPTRAIAEDWQRSVGPMGWWPQGKAHFMGPLVEAARKGAQIPLLRASPAARRYVMAWAGDDRKLVTLTLRAQDTDPERNTNAEAWMQMDERLQGSGYRVVVVDEAQRALLAGRGYAELDIDLRLALYEHAAMNLIGNNGPSELLKFSAAPYQIFGLGLTEGWQNHIRKFFAMQPGEQLPWARPGQRLVYRPDSPAVLQEEFERWATATR